MTVRELTNCYWEKIKIYTKDNNDFIELYNGLADYIPYNLLNRRVKHFASVRKGIIDVCVA